MALDRQHSTQFSRFHQQTLKLARVVHTQIDLVYTSSRQNKRKRKRRTGKRKSRGSESGFLQRVDNNKTQDVYFISADYKLLVYLLHLRDEVVSPDHTNAFSFINAYFSLRFRLLSTLMRSKTEVSRTTV